MTAPVRALRDHVAKPLGESDGAVRPQELAAVPMLARLPVTARRKLSAHALVRRYEGGQAVLEEGEPGDALHVVRRGVLKVVRPSRDPEQVLQLLTSGQMFGELAVLNSSPRLASVVALGEAETIEVRKEDLDRVLDQHPEAVREMLGALAESVTLMKEEVARQNCVLEERVRERTREVRESQLEVIRRLAQAAEYRDGLTGLHTNRMSRLCAALAPMLGLSADESEMVLYAAPLHDIGKIGIPDRILLKEGPLDPDEWEVMKTHATTGANLLSGGRSALVQMAELIALTHHERWDGSGYPLGLKGEQIPLVSRICAVCDAFDAMVTDRPYKAAIPVADALAEIARESGRHFDPQVADAAQEMLPLLRALPEGADAPPAPGHATGVRELRLVASAAISSET